MIGRTARSLAGLAPPTGGGLTVIANAPNPAGIGILHSAKVSGGEGISPLGLFLGALFPTAVAVVFFWVLF